MEVPVPFGDFVARAHAAGQLVAQPRMGFSQPAVMRQGLLRTKWAAAVTVGTITLDSYTRLGDTASAARALADGVDLNGYPITTHGTGTTTGVLAGIRDQAFPVQVRHGSPDPREIFAAIAKCGLDATEGGPISYCLPYSRTSLREAVGHWARSCELFVERMGPTAHLETFGGCMLGQLCPPSMLVAISVLEGIFFARHGVSSISLSYAQQVNPEQDEEAIWALRRLAAELLPGVDWHVVIYAYMGVYPRTQDGAGRLLELAARLAVRSGAARLIVKTAAEAYRIPTIDENVDALELASKAVGGVKPEPAAAMPAETGIYREARALVEATLNLDSDLDRALTLAFARGYLDIPYCLHPDNPGDVRSYIDEAGWLQWSDTGRLPVPEPVRDGSGVRLTAAGLVAALSHVERIFDRNNRAVQPEVSGDDKAIV